MLPQHTSPAQCTQAAGAIPYRWSKGRLEFCIITSSTGRWIFPKGMIEPGDSQKETALKEASEEAGLHGKILSPPLGHLHWEKLDRSRGCLVIFFLMEVRKTDRQWLESNWRERRWVTIGEAKKLIDSGQLVALLDEACERLKKQAD